MVSRGRAPSVAAAVPDGVTASVESEPSRNGLARERVADIQRARMLAAMVALVAERGLADTAVARVVRRAGVSRRTFYEHFEDREECFLAAFDDGVERASRWVLDAYDPKASWVQRVGTALAASLSFLDSDRDTGRLLVVESLGAGAMALERRRRVLAPMIALVEEGRGQARAGSQPAPLTAEGVVGGALSIVHARLLGAEPGRLVELAGPLTSMIALPYLGPAVARRELARPAPKPRVSVPSADGDPLRDLGMRLTYRTVRVLLSVAAAPHSSNREIGEAAGIGDQGQMSKMLGRLERLGLVQNAGLAPGKGAPNAWVLTPKGRQVEQAMRPDR
jgi:AcrR family transcriptional regulator